MPGGMEPSANGLSTYFDFHGGRAEPVRLALHIGGIPFEDQRFTFSEFAEVRKSTPFGQVTTLMVDGVQVTQCDSILRYAGKLAGLYPLDAFQALLCDGVMYVVEEVGLRSQYEACSSDNDARIISAAWAS